MSKVSIFEYAKSKKVNFSNEIIKIRNITFHDGTVDEYCEEAYITSSLNYLGTDLEDAFCEILEIKHLFDGLWIDSSVEEELLKVDLNKFLLFLGFIYNIFVDYKHKTDKMNQAMRIVENCVDRLGYFIGSDEEGRYAICLKSEIAEAIAVTEELQLKNIIYKYLSIREGNISAKIECLKFLADYVEVICKKYNEDKYLSKVSEYMQYVRHAKEVKEKQFPMFYAFNYEQNLDFIFEILISALQIDKCKQIIKNFDLLRNKKTTV